MWTRTNKTSGVANFMQCKIKKTQVFTKIFLIIFIFYKLKKKLLSTLKRYSYKRTVEKL